MALTFDEKPFSLSVLYLKKTFTVDILPFYMGLRVAYRVISPDLPELVIGLDAYDSWEEIGGQSLISPGLLFRLGELIDQHVL